MNHAIHYTEVNPVYAEGRKTTIAVIVFTIFIVALALI